MSRYRFIAVEKANYSGRCYCVACCSVASSGYYAWRHRQPSRRSQANAVLTDQIRAVHERSRGTYGAPRIHAELHVEQPVSRKRVARLMRAAGLAGRPPRRFRRTTIPDPKVQLDGPGPAQFHRQRTGPEVVRRHHLHPHLGRLAVPGGHHRRVQS